jgi:ABC-2 type transport system permease protein
VPVLRAPAALLVLSAAVAAAATGFGVLFAVLCRTRKQLEGLSTIVILAMSAFGGSWWPLAITPEWYQKLAHFTLTAWAMDGYQGLFWYGKDLAGIALPIGVLLAIAGGTSGVAAVLWRRRIAV